MAKRSGMYKYEKRQKELKRQKKKEEKRLKRLKAADEENSPMQEDTLTENADQDTGDTESE